MRKNTFVVGILLTFAVTLASTTAQAQEPPPPHVTNVIVLETSGDLGKLADIVKRARMIGEKYGSTGKARVWMTTLAGPNTGNVVVAVEYPSLVSMAESLSKVNASPDWTRLVADAQAAGIKPVSNSVVVEITP